MSTHTAATLFLNSVIPLLKEVALRTELRKSYEKSAGTFLISVHEGGEKRGTHLINDHGEIQIKLGLPEETPDVELEFMTVAHFVNFFKGHTKKLPKIRGIKKVSQLALYFRTLLKMSSLLSVKEAPEALEDKELLTRLMFYLLTSGISQLNKLKEPSVHEWAKKSPDRVYALTVSGYEDLGAYIRVKAGKSRSARGNYKRSKPFLTMRFADVDSALAILLQTGDLLNLTAEEKLIMEGAPEFGAKLGDFMMLVGSIIQD